MRTFGESQVSVKECRDTCIAGIALMSAYATTAPEFVPDTRGGSSTSGESSEMLGGDRQREPFAGLGAHGVEHLRVN